MNVISSAAFLAQTPRASPRRALPLRPRLDNRNTPRGRTSRRRPPPTMKSTDSTGMQSSLRSTISTRTVAECCLAEARASAVEALDEIFYSSDRQIVMHDDRVARRFELVIRRFLSVCARVEQMGLSTDALNDLKDETRRQFENLWLESEIGYEIVKWPRGMGSARVSQLLHEGTSCQTSSLKAYYSERFLRDSDLAHAVRGRKDTLRDAIEAEVIQRDGEDIRILDLANGPCRVIKELIPKWQRSTIDSISYVGIDRDESIQDTNVQFVEDRQCDEQFLFLAKSIFRFDIASEGPWDICFSTGLFDYLNDKTLVKLWSRLYESLNPNGVVVICLKDSSHYNSQLYHWLMKWDGFRQRNTDQIEDLLEQAGILDRVENVMQEPTGIVKVYVVRKPGTPMTRTNTMNFL